jgi:hypothetical protein
MDDFDETKLFSPNAIKSSVLSGYYRIPTRGKFLPDVSLTMSGELPVYPMKASDEMLLKNPDSLMSGLALEGLFASCIPAIKNPRDISMPDIDVLLVAIRAATYGEKMMLDVTCPSCKAEYEYSCHLPGLLTTMTYVDEDTNVLLSEQVSVNVKPYTLYDASRVAFLAFEETRILQNLDATTAQDDAGRRIRMNKMNQSIEKVTELNQMIITSCINFVSVPESTVTDKKEILSFIKNIPKPWYEKIEERIQEMNQHGIDKKIHITCDSCQHEWDTHLEIDPTSFFDASS